VAGTYRFLKNIMGLWIVQQCRATWRSQGGDFDYAGLTEMARSAAPFAAFIDPDDAAFLPPGDMPARIAAFCARSGQPVPERVAGVMRCVLESLALKYRYVLDLLVEVSDRPVDVLHIVGGGAKNELLNQMTANAIQRPVVAGPAEATALGNALVQWMALGAFESLSEAREAVRASFMPRVYQPEDRGEWQEAYARFRDVLSVTESLG
jgi:rhamnulokinase